MTNFKTTTFDISLFQFAVSFTVTQRNSVSNLPANEGAFLHFFDS